MSDSMGMDPCTLSSLKFFTEGVLIPSPCPSTPESCQSPGLCPFHEIGLVQFYHLSAVFLAAYAASWMFHPTGISRTTIGINATGSVFLLYNPVQNKASRGNKYKVASPLTIMSGWW